MGFDGVGELWTSCSIHGDFKVKTTSCKYFEKKVTKSDLLNKLYEENEQLKKEYKIAIDEMVTDYKKLEEENEQLREALKNSYNWEICENCEYANYSSHYVYAEGIEYDFECLKGHAHVDEMSECDEFKLKIR